MKYQHKLIKAGHLTAKDFVEYSTKLLDPSEV